MVGGGVPGLALAALLGQLGITVTVADKYPPPPLCDVKPDGRTAALMQGSVNILKATGAWEKSAAYGEDLKILRIIDDSAGRAQKPVQVDFEAPEIRMDAFGVNMPLTPLRSSLAETIEKCKTVFTLKAALTNYTTDPGGITANFDDGSTVKAKLIVGADGRSSQTREIAGIKTRERDYDQRAITCLIHHSQSHNNISTEFHRPSGPFTMVPMPGNCSSIVWVDFSAPATQYMTMSKQAFEQALQDRSRDLLGKISMATTPQSWPLKALQTRQLTAPRLALMAEAAHVIHPLGAQGLNLSLRDVAALAEIIVDSMRLGLDPGCAAVLDQYERRRRQDVLSRVIGTDRFNRMVSTDLGMARNLRKLGLKTLEHITPLREFVMQQGLAPQQNAGRLAKGQPL